MTEFLPRVSWSGKHNTISCAAGHHFYEGRWLANPRYLDDYTLFWFRRGGEPRRYSFWAADAIYARYLVNHKRAFLVSLLDDLVANFEAWEYGWSGVNGVSPGGEAHLDPNGLFWQLDDRDGMEMSIGGHGYRPSTNSYFYGDAVAIAEIAHLSGRSDVAKTYRSKVAKIKHLVQRCFWDSQADFFKILPRGEGKTLVGVRELIGYVPWYFNLPDHGYERAWKQLTDSEGFYAQHGPTTAEQRHPRFAISYEGHECQWNGPSWPYLTSLVLTALANLLNNYEQDYIGKEDYLYLLKTYACSQHRTLPNGTVVPWIDENLNPYTGDWIARTRLSAWKNGTWDARKGGVERGRDYNHSTYCDLVISGLVGVHPRADNILELRPLVPNNTWDYFCLDQIHYHGQLIDVLYDSSGKRYGKGKGLRVFVNGREIVASPCLERLTVDLGTRSGNR
ncbi:glycosyl hydrolase family 65 protein [Candidatus Poribacteria bacterium]